MGVTETDDVMIPDEHLSDAPVLELLQWKSKYSRHGRPTDENRSKKSKEKNSKNRK